MCMYSMWVCVVWLYYFWTDYFGRIFIWTEFLDGQLIPTDMIRTELTDFRTDFFIVNFAIFGALSVKYHRMHVYNN